MVETSGETELTRASRKFLDPWRTQRLRNGDAMPYFDPHEFWFAALDVLRAYRRSDLCSNSLMPHHGIPPVMLDELALLLEELLAGRIPDKVLPLLTVGAPSLRPVERRARVCAAAYVNFARQGLIDDKAPVRTIREKFGIKARTASVWINRHLFGEPWLPSERLPEQDQALSVAGALDAVAEEYARLGRAQDNRFKYKRPKRKRPPRGR